MKNTILTDETFYQKGYSISTDKQLLDLEMIYDFLENRCYWAKGITLLRLQKAIDNSLCFGIYNDGNLCGFARVITDHATFAYLCDVFIIETHRGHGLSKWLMQNIQQHQELMGLRRWSLATADAHDLYRQYGFMPLSTPDRWMEIFTPYQVPVEMQK